MTDRSIACVAPERPGENLTRVHPGRTHSSSSAGGLATGEGTTDGTGPPSGEHFMQVPTGRRNSGALPETSRDDYRRKKYTYFATTPPRCGRRHRTRSGNSVSQLLFQTT